MLNDREKLTDLIIKNLDFLNWDRAYEAADYLIANGLTVQTHGWLEDMFNGIIVINKLSKVTIQILLSFAEHNMNVTETSRVLFFHRNTVAYHLEKVKNKTGLNPYNFYDLMKLVLCLREGDQS